MQAWLRQAGVLWALAAALMLVPMFIVLQARTPPLWYAALAGAINCLPAVVLGAIVLAAARGRPDRGVRAARIVTALVTAILAFALLYPQLR